MIIPDTSVWADHIRRGNAALAEQLRLGRIITHDFVLGELSLGFLRRDDPFVLALEKLPRLPTQRHAEVMSFARARRLEGRGVGWIDAHLLCSAVVSATPLWTLDRALLEAARELRLVHTPA